MTTGEFPLDTDRDWRPEVGSEAYRREYSVAARLAHVGASAKAEADADSLAEIEARVREAAERLAFGRSIKPQVPVLPRAEAAKQRKHRHHWRGGRCLAVVSKNILRAHPLMSDEEFGAAITNEFIETCMTCTQHYLDRRRL
jgi:hypothetical protein